MPMDILFVSSGVVCEVIIALRERLRTTMMEMMSIVQKTMLDTTTPMVIALLVVRGMKGPEDDGGGFVRIEMTVLVVRLVIPALRS